MSYVIITDATADLSSEMVKNSTQIEILPMQIQIGGNSYFYGLPDAMTADQFYTLQRDGNYASTSQISPGIYCEYWEPYLEHGDDVLYLCFSSGMSGTLMSAQIASEELKKRYPQRKIVIADTLAGSVGEGLLVYEAARKQSEGMDLDDLSDWILAHRMEACHRFTVDQFDHLQHGGRVSAAAAAVGTMLQIKPMLRVDEQGKLVVIQKPRGRKKAISALVAQMEAGWMPEISRTVIVGHGGNPEIARELYDSVAASFPEADLHISEIGPVIGAHTGPDMLALTYWGNNR